MSENLQIPRHLCSRDAFFAGDEWDMHCPTCGGKGQCHNVILELKKAQLDAQRLTMRQAIILTGFTGVMCAHEFSIFHADVERRLGRPVFTHEFAGDIGKKLTKELYRDEFMALLPASLAAIPAEKDGAA